MNWSFCELSDYSNGQNEYNCLESHELKLHVLHTINKSIVFEVKVIQNNRHWEFACVRTQSDARRSGKSRSSS